MGDFDESSQQPLVDLLPPSLMIHWNALMDGHHLYGRDESQLQLSHAYEKWCLHQTNTSSEREIILLSGPSGVGKTALASTLKDRVFGDHGFFLSGKFDQVTATNHLTAKSYGPFVDAFTEYVKQVQEAGTQTVASIRRVLLETMIRSELLVLLETIPALNKILRFRQNIEQVRDIVLRGADAEERFLYIFCKFIQTIASQSSPVVLLLDDIQWINPSALNLLKAVAAIERKKANCQLLILCTCRNDNRVSFDQLCCDLRDGVNCSIKVTNIELSSLSRDAVANLVTDALPSLDPNKAPAIVDIIYDNTRGNAFHLLQFLKVIEKEGLLNTLEAGKKEVCNMDQSHTVVQLLIAGIIEKLPEKVKDVMMVAACLGCVFSEECLVAGVFLPESETLEAIRCCEREGIVAVSTADAHTFRFTHDKFQQSIYMLIPDEKKDAFHLNVGLRLWHWLSLDAREEHLMLMGNQISRAIRLVKDKEERDNVANLFLQAGKKAARSSSFSAAAAHLKCGIDLLNSKHWKKQYKLSLMLYNTAAEIEYYCGNFERVDALVAEVLRGAQSFDDTLVARFTRIYSLGSRCEMVQALEEGFVVLKHLGEPLPRRVSYLRTVRELLSCKWMLYKKSDQELLESPVLKDKKKLTALRLMIIMHTFAFNRGNKYGPIIAARAVKISLKHGINELSCAGFAILALVLAVRGDVEDAYRCSKSALCVYSKYQSTEWQARLGAIIYGCSFPMKHPLRDSINPLLDGHRAGLVFGDIHFSVLCAYYVCFIKLYAGDPIPEILDAAMTYRKLCPQYGQNFIIPAFNILIQMFLNLMGESTSSSSSSQSAKGNNNSNINSVNKKNPLILSGEAMQEEEAMVVWKTKNPLCHLLFLGYKHLLAVYLTEHQVARDLAKKIRLAKAKLSPAALIAHQFLQALASDKVSERQQLLGKLKQAAQHCPTNCLHKVYLVEAEMANSAGSYQEAWNKYDMAIAHAEQHGFIHEQALSCERAAYAMRARGRRQEAVAYFSQASVLYGTWGARVKVDQLAKELLQTNTPT